MTQPVRMGVVFPRSGQRLFVMVSIQASNKGAHTLFEQDNRSCRSKAAAHLKSRKSDSLTD